MKKLLCVLFSAVLIASLSGCDLGGTVKDVESDISSTVSDIESRADDMISSGKDALSSALPDASSEQSSSSK